VNELHLFAGDGGGIQGGILLGHRAVCAVEINKKCRDRLIRKQRDGILPAFPIWDNVETFDANPWNGKVDVVCGGFPCQDISSARSNSDVNGQMRGVDGEKSGLYKHVLRVMRESGAKYGFFENSPNLRTRGLVRILNELARLGYNARWATIGSDAVGADHQRKRMFMLAYSDRTQLEGGCLSSRVSKEYANTIRANRRKNQSRVERVQDGLGAEMDRLRGIGNGQDAVVASTIFHILSRGLI